jgi:MFS family permease
MPRSFVERFPALQSADYRNIWIGQIVSNAGSQMQRAALAWQIYELTRDPLYLGLIGLVRIGPVLFFSLLGGAVADARDRRRLLLLTQSILALSSATLAFLTYTDRIGIGSIYLLTALSASALAFDNPARQALLPSLVPREHLSNAFALNSTGGQVATISGPMIAGIIIAGSRHGVALAYLLNALSFLAIIAALATLRYRPTEGVSAGRVSIDALKEGLRFVWRTPILVSTMTLDFFATFFSSASALLPMFAKDILHVDAFGYGVLTASPAVGSFLAGAILSVLPAIRRQGKTMILAVVAYGLATVGFGASPWFWLSALFLAGTGAADTVSTVIRQTIRQMVTPDHLRGRMVSVTMVFFMGGPQLGELEAGAVARWVSAPFSVISGGIACLFATFMVGRLAPSLWRYEPIPIPHREGGVQDSALASSSPTTGPAAELPSPSSLGGRGAEGVGRK